MSCWSEAICGAPNWQLFGPQCVVRDVKTNLTFTGKERKEGRKEGLRKEIERKTDYVYWKKINVFTRMPS